MKKEVKKINFILSDILKNKITEKLNLNEQIILFLNRRGYSPFVTCTNCGYTYKCPKLLMLH
jgi:primosomal protein N' (replication factor Y)